jgi:uncharacterized repeat protein (TIGR02543 family)
MASYAVTYNANGASGGTVPVDGSSPYATGAIVTILGNPGGLIKAGATFIGWGTAATGGILYQPAQTFIMGGGAIILYAQWSVNGTSMPYDPSSVDPLGDKISSLAFLSNSVAGTLLSASGAYPGLAPSMSASEASAIQCDLANLSAAITALAQAATATINATTLLEEDQVSLDSATAALQAALGKIEGDIDAWVAAS